MIKQKKSSLKKRLGDMLVDVGLITSEQLATALSYQQKTGEKLGKIFLDMGVLTRELLLAFLGKQCGVSYISLNEFGKISPEALRCIPAHIARRQVLIPIAREGEDITVAMADPFNIFAVDDLKLLTGGNIDVVIASEQEILQAIDEYYNRQKLPEDIPAEFTIVGLPKEIDLTLKQIIYQGLKLSALSAHLEPGRVRFRLGNWFSSYLLKSDIDLSALVAGRSSSEIVAALGERMSKIDIVNQYPRKVIIKFSNIAANYDNLNNLGLAEEFLAIYRKVLNGRRGLVIISGPDNSGKSTTLQATASYLNYPDRNIVWLGKDDINEGDIIFADGPISATAVHQLIKMSINNKLIVLSYPAESPLGVIADLLDSGVARQLLAAGLSAIVNQRIVRRICPHCKTTYEISGEYLIRSLTGQSESIPDYLNELADKKLVLSRGNGCEICAYTGYLGYSSVAKIIPVDEDIRRTLMNTSRESDLLTIFQRKGTTSLARLVWEKIIKGQTTIEELILRE